MNRNNKAPGVIFEDEEFQQSTQSFQAQTPKIIEWVIKYSGGYVKDKKQANYVLIGFVVVAVVITVLLIMSGGSDIKGPIPEGTSLTVPG